LLFYIFPYYPPVFVKTDCIFQLVFSKLQKKMAIPFNQQLFYILNPASLVCRLIFLRLMNNAELTG